MQSFSKRINVLPSLAKTWMNGVIERTLIASNVSLPQVTTLVGSLKGITPGIVAVVLQPVNKVAASTIAVTQKVFSYLAS